MSGIFACGGRLATPLLLVACLACEDGGPSQADAGLEAPQADAAGSDAGDTDGGTAACPGPGLFDGELPDDGVCDCAPRVVSKGKGGADWVVRHGGDVYWTVSYDGQPGGAVSRLFRAPAHGGDAVLLAEQSWQHAMIGRVVPLGTTLFWGEYGDMGYADIVSFDLVSCSKEFVEAGRFVFFPGSDGVHLYWKEDDGGTVGKGILKRSALDGSEVVELGGPFMLSGLVLHGDHLYFSDTDDQLHSVPTAGGPVVPLGPAGEIRVIADGFVYWTTKAEDGSMAIWRRQTTADATPAVVVENDESIHAIHVTAERLFWRTDGKLMTANPDGTGAADVADANVSSGGIAADDTTVYWADDEEIRALDLCCLSAP